MKSRISIIKVLIKPLILIIGFILCFSAKVAAQYGCFYPIRHLTGKVLSYEDKTPIHGIEIRQHIKTLMRNIVVAQSDTLGQFYLRVPDYRFYDNINVELLAIDIDSTENGGKYLETPFNLKSKDGLVIYMKKEAVIQEEPEPKLKIRKISKVKKEPLSENNNPKDNIEEFANEQKLSPNIRLEDKGALMIDKKKDIVILERPEPKLKRTRKKQKDEKPLERENNFRNNIEGNTESQELNPTNSFEDTGTEKSSVERMAEKPEIDIQVYPNPTSGEFRVTYSNEEPQHIDILIKDVTGRIIEKRSLVGKTSNFNESFNLQSEASGTYLIEIITQKGIFTRRIVKK